MLTALDRAIDRVVHESPVHGPILVDAIEKLKTQLAHYETEEEIAEVLR